MLQGLRTRLVALGLVALLGFVPAACAVEDGGGSSGGGSQPSQGQAQGPKTTQIEPAQAQRLQRVMAPLIQHMDKPIPAGKVKITVWDDPHINAANGGGGDFYVTTGLLRKANDDQLRAILAHEIAHADLGHVANQQILGAGLNIGISLLEQILPGSSALTPVAGQLIASAYGRREETEADAHAVALLRKGGHDGKKLMASTLQWIGQTEGTSRGGFFSTHPATEDRIAAVQKL